MIGYLSSLLDWPVVFIVRRQREMEALGFAVLTAECKAEFGPDARIALVDWGTLREAAERWLSS